MNCRSRQWVQALEFSCWRISVRTFRHAWARSTAQVPQGLHDVRAMRVTTLTFKALLFCSAPPPQKKKKKKKLHIQDVYE